MVLHNRTISDYESITDSDYFTDFYHISNSDYLSDSDLLLDSNNISIFFSIVQKYLFFYDCILLSIALSVLYFLFNLF